MGSCNSCDTGSERTTATVDEMRSIIPRHERERQTMLSNQEAVSEYQTQRNVKLHPAQDNVYVDYDLSVKDAVIGKYLYRLSTMPRLATTESESKSKSKSKSKEIHDYSLNFDVEKEFGAGPAVVLPYGVKTERFFTKSPRSEILIIVNEYMNGFSVSSKLKFMKRKTKNLIISIAVPKSSIYEDIFMTALRKPINHDPYHCIITNVRNINRFDDDTEDYNDDRKRNNYDGSLQSMM